MVKKNVFYAQAGGVTAVINATACGVIETARQHKDRVGKVYAGHNGIIGALTEDLIDTSKESARAIAALRHTPGGAFGSCRFMLKSIEENQSHYERLIEVFRAHNIGYFFYNGGNGSMNTADKVAQISSTLGYPIQCIGIPKTIDNDLAHTDNCPGFGSAAKYIAVSITEAALDVASMARTSTKVFVMEVMGRYTGWIAAASGIAARNEGDAPHLILFPEVPFNEATFLQRVKQTVVTHEYCVIVVAEGIKDANGQFISAGERDAFGDPQLGGAGPRIVNLIKTKLGYKCHHAVADYLQRSARHIASKIDVEQAYALGRAAVQMALQGKNAIMPNIVRTSNTPYRWRIGEVSLATVAKKDKNLPASFITKDGYGITKACRTYLMPLIKGEDYPPYKDGLPQFVRLKNLAVPKKLATEFKI
ncbi:MAG: 6-phosphofructokinase [Gammaproteobacteria bacterium]|nr:6-phosphofructokinase [Gammaproteobacteria bacterium]